MNIEQLQTLKSLYLQARNENPGWIGINFAVGEMQVSGHAAMLEIAPLHEWTRENIDDSTHVFFKIEKYDLTWTCCFRRENAPAPLPVDESMNITFAAGGVDYTDKPETAQVDEDGSLRF